MYIPSPWAKREPILDHFGDDDAATPRRVSLPPKKQPSVIQEKGESELERGGGDGTTTSAGPHHHPSSSSDFMFSSRESSAVWGGGSSTTTGGGGGGDDSNTPTDEFSPIMLSTYGRKSRVDLEREKRYLKRYLREIRQEKELIKGLWEAEKELGQGYSVCDSLVNFCSLVEVFLSNMPLTIGAVGLSWVTQGVVWFKFMEENVAACTPVRFNSPKCSFPEFPGCFQCDTADPIYRIGLTWHYFCHVVAGFCCVLFLCKVVLAWRVVADELANPATSTPVGVVCITAVCVFAGRGAAGELIVLGTSVFHFGLSFWFLHTAIHVYRLWPDPGWFPNTVGLAYAAIKTWLYFPWTGKILMMFCMTFFFSTFFISLYRVARNEKIALPVCFIQLSAPSITLYAVTILAQPDHHREVDIENDAALMQHFEDIHRTLYLPFQNCMLALSLAGMASVLHALYVRWDQFRQKEFSPAHMALVFPVLSHTNAIQAYRSGVDSFSEIPQRSPFKIGLFTYWFVLLIVGTILCLVFTYHYVKRLPKWTRITVTDEDEAEDDEQFPLSPSDQSSSVATAFSSSFGGVMESLGNHSDADGHHPSSSLVSPAVLHANEAGALVRVRRGTDDYERHGPYKRTRRGVSSLGFDPILSQLELECERARLLEWAARNAPRRRNRTLSIPSALRLAQEGVVVVPFLDPQQQQQQQPLGNGEATAAGATYGTMLMGAAEGGERTTERGDTAASHQRSRTSLV